MAAQDLKEPIPIELPQATLVVTNPSGNRTQVLLKPLPFRIGRLSENTLALRDSRISRHHAQIVLDGGSFVLEDLDSRHGVFVNGARIRRHRLRDSDRIQFGFADSYELTFLHSQPTQGTLPSELLGSNLPKLRAMLEVARALQTSLSTDEVLAAVVDAALTVTRCERGFLLMRNGGELEIRIARDRTGPLPAADLRVPARLLLRALEQRKEFLSMSFDPEGEESAAMSRTIADLGLTGVVCVPVVRVRTGSEPKTTVLSPADDTVGLIYMDSRTTPMDLSAGNRELLTTLALEASTILENARLLEEQWARQRMETELKIAHRIQENLLPRALPSSGWLRAAGSSIPSREVGGDYYDLRQATPGHWYSVVVDVSGKGVGAALLAALLQGIFLAAPYSMESIEEMMARVNRFLLERTAGEQYATVFYCALDSSGRLVYVNAGHPPAFVSSNGAVRRLPAGSLPVGLLEQARYSIEEIRLEPGDKLVVYTDGLSEATNSTDDYFGLTRIAQTLAANSQAGAAAIHDAIIGALEEYTRGAEQGDDITLLVMEYRP